MQTPEEIFSSALDGLKDNVSRVQVPHEFLKGTTCLAIVNQSGVIIASDGRATVGHTKMTEVCDKLFELDRYSVLAIAGSLSYAQMIATNLQAQFSFEADKFEGCYIPPKTKLNYVIRLMRQSGIVNLTQPVFVPLLGIFDDDPEDMRGRVFSVWYDGSLKPEAEYDSIGSGSPTARPVMDTLLHMGGFLKRGLHKSLSQKLALDIALYAFYRVRTIDAGTGGRLNVRLITRNGVTTVPQDEVTAGYARLEREGVRL